MGKRRIWSATAPSCRRAVLSAFLAGAAGAGLPLWGWQKWESARVRRQDGTRVADLEQLSRRVAHLERLDGREVGLETPGAREPFEAAYRALATREVELAARMHEALRAVPSISPVEGGVITSTYSLARFHPIRRRIQSHEGVDIGARLGDPVRAPAAGVIRVTSWHRDYGLVVDVDHLNGFVTRMGHLSRIDVRPGQGVERGGVLGRAGATGVATGVHVHYEVYYQGRARDPMRFLPALPVAPATPSGTRFQQSYRGGSKGDAPGVGANSSTGE